MKFLYRKSSIKPPGAYLFQAHLRGSLIETGGIFKREGLFNLEKTTVSVLHKELEYKVEKPVSYTHLTLPTNREV